jgi:predicted branched-subunit amino acid permease
MARRSRRRLPWTFLTRGSGEEGGSGIVGAVLSTAAEPALPDARRGALAMAPVLLGVAPFGFVIGAAASSGPTPAAGWAATFLFFAGSAHLAVVQLLDAGAGLVTVVTTGLVVQARLVAFSASLAPHWAGWRGWHRALAAATIIDPTWALAQDRYSRPGSEGALRAWYAGAAAMLAVGWGAAVTAGFLSGGSLSVSAGWKLVSPLLLLALVVPQVRTAGAYRAVAAAAVVAVCAGPLPSGTAVVLAMAAGALAGRGRS